MIRPPASFDRDIALLELLRAVPRARVESALCRTVGEVWRLVDADGLPVWTAAATAIAAASAVDVADPTPGPPEFSVPLRVDIDIVGRLMVPDARQEQARIAAGWLEMVLTSASRYRMAADLHLETVFADYAALQAKHAALQESEARYRTLSGQLEERVEAQVEVIERTHRRLFQSEKMASIGSLAAGMAHEINNPIGFIRSNLNTASIYLETMTTAFTTLRRNGPGCAEAVWREADLGFVMDDFAGLIAESVTGADRIARIVGNLKTFSRVDCDATEGVDLNEAVRASSALIADQLPDEIRIELDLHVLPLVACELGSMNQVLLALLQNARQAIGAAPGTIRISSRVAADVIQIAVSDNGSGISDDIVSRVFDPFFTTRGVGKGMGLGLTISSDIVGAYRGRLDVDTAAGVGSTFTVSLPLTPGSAAPGQPS